MMSPVFEVKKEILDKSFFRGASCATAPFGVLAFWGGMLMAARGYPSEYDWRYMPVSNLLSPDRNPDGYLWASAGIVLCSLCGLCWVAVLARRWSHEGARDRPSGIKALQFGNWCMICAALMPRRLLPIQKGARNPRGIGICRPANRDGPPDVPDYEADLPEADAQVQQSCTAVCSHLG